MKGELLIRKTGQKDKSDREIAVVIGVVALENIDNYKDGCQYNIIDIALNKPRDITELNKSYSPEDLLEMNIWHLPK